MTDASDAERNGAPVVVVTGAARGLGRALCEELVARGARVAGIGRSVESLKGVSDTLRDREFLPLVADVADPDALARAFLAVDARFGPLDVLINNAAIYPRRDILDETQESFLATLAVNVGGVAGATIEALKRMVPTGKGRIVNVTSFAGRHPVALSGAYSVSKGALQIFTKALVADLGDRFPGIVVTDWIPGALQTEMGIPDGISPERAAKWGASLAMWHDRDLNGAVFAENEEILPQRSRKRRLFDRVTGRTRVVRRLPD